MLDALPGFFDNTRCIGTKDMRQRDLGRVFAAHNPDVEVIERESLHADKHFVVGYLRNWKIANLDSLVTSEFVIVECFHGSFSCFNAPRPSPSTRSRRIHEWYGHSKTGPCLPRSELRACSTLR